MRRLMAMICCLVLATTLVARGGGVMACGMTCCGVPSRAAAMNAATATTTTAPTTSPACCDIDSKPATPTPADHEPHAAMPADMPCCAAVAWMPILSATPVVGDVVAHDVIASTDGDYLAARPEPATPPPRATA